MPNKQSTKKSLRSAFRKKLHNLYWKKRMKTAEKAVVQGIAAKESPEILTDKLKAFQKVLDKASKNKVLHKNKANRLKSNYAKKATALFTTPVSPKKHKK